MSHLPGDRPNGSLDLVGALKSLRYIAMSHLDENAQVALESRGHGVVVRIEWNSKVAEYAWDASLYDLPHPRTAIENRVQLICAELAKTRTQPLSPTMHAVQAPANRGPQHAVARMVPARIVEPVRVAAREPEIRPSRHDISRIEASVRRVLTDSITASSVVRIVIRADPSSGLPVRVLDGIPRGFKPAADGRLRVVIEVVGGETDQLILLDRISMVSQAPT